jgi:hypothetical protein
MLVLFVYFIPRGLISAWSTFVGGPDFDSKFCEKENLKKMPGICFAIIKRKKKKKQPPISSRVAAPITLM